MIAHSDYRRGNARELTNYMKRDGEERVALRDPSGKRVTSEEWEEFVEYSEEMEMERQIIFSPDPEADWSEEELDRRTRRTMSEVVEDMPSARYVYSVHDSSEPKHVHVAVTGKERDLYMDADDLEELQETAGEQFRETEKLAEAESRVGTAREPERESVADREPEREYGGG